MDLAKRKTLDAAKSCLVLLLVVTLSLTRPGSARQLRDVSSALNMQCPPCDKMHCTPKNPKKLNCKGGITHGVCNCCPKCARVEGQSCGGYREYLGKCDRGLYCQVGALPYGQELEGVCMPGWWRSYFLARRCEKRTLRIIAAMC